MSSREEYSANSIPFGLETIATLLKHPLLVGVAAISNSIGSQWENREYAFSILFRFIWKPSRPYQITPVSGGRSQVAAIPIPFGPQTDELGPWVQLNRAMVSRWSKLLQLSWPVLRSFLDFFWFDNLNCVKFVEGTSMPSSNLDRKSTGRFVKFLFVQSNHGLVSRCSKLQHSWPVLRSFLEFSWYGNLFFGNLWKDLSFSVRILIRHLRSFSVEHSARRRMLVVNVALTRP